MRIVFFVILVLLGTISSFAQCGNMRAVCNSEMNGFVLDGQYRSANLASGKSKIFRSTFYGNRLYKLVVANKEGLGNVRFKILNSSYKILFDSAKHNYPSSWQLEFANTSDFLIEISFKDETNLGCALLMIGFEI